MTATMATVDSESGQILMRCAFGDLAACKRLGGKFNSRQRAWVFAATQENARSIQDAIPKLRTTPEFDVLAGPLQAEEVEAAPDPDNDSAERACPSCGCIETCDCREETSPGGAGVGVSGEVTTVAGPEVDAPVPAGMLRQPWPHQMAAYLFCLAHFARGLMGLLLAMGMGTGKSLVAVMLVLGLAARRVLIVCPLRVIPVWTREFGRHAGIDLEIVALDEDAGSVTRKSELAQEKMRLAEVRGVPFICVINHDSVWREPFASWAEKLAWDFLFADEGHRLKGVNGKASKWFKRMRLHAHYRVALTGTPMPHGPMDVFAVFRFLDIRIFGPSFTAFRARYAVMGGFQKKQITGYQRLEEFEALLSQITYRVGKEVLDLPPETDVTYHCELGPEARRVYRNLEEDFVSSVLEGTITVPNAMVVILRLHQVTNGIVKTDDGKEIRIDDSKRRLLADVLEDIGNEEPVAVFCRFHLDLDAVHEACQANGLTSMELSGRQDDLAKWQDGGAQVIAVQISAGGVGVDLTRARYSIYYSVGFSLADYLQARSRVHRPGQTRPVEHIHLIARNSVDVKIMRALEKRAEVVDSILAEIKN